MTRLLCEHPEESREPLPYDGVHPADPDDWQCVECGATGLRLDRRSYEDRVAADEEFEELQRLADEELRQQPFLRTRTLRTREGDLVTALPLPAMDFRSESMTEALEAAHPSRAEPPRGTKLVLVSDELMDVLAEPTDESAVAWAWGEPDEHGWYTPAFTRHRRAEARPPEGLDEAELVSLLEDAIGRFRQLGRENTALWFENALAAARLSARRAEPR